MRKGMIWFVTMLVVFATVMTAAAQRRVTVPAGTRILIRTTDSIDSNKQKAGYRFTASLETNLQANSVVVAPRGTTVYGQLASASSILFSLRRMKSKVREKAGIRRRKSLEEWDSARSSAALQEGELEPG
jgi:hypothetical protein